MDTYQISEVAERTGFSSPTIRYYESIGLLPEPARLESGYRVYDERSLDRLTFIGRAKRLGISLDEIRELAAIWEAEDCSPVQRRLAATVAARLSVTRDRIAELAALEAQLEAVVVKLGAEPVAGPCNDDCACNTCFDDAAPSPISVQPRRAGRDAAEVPISCSLGAAGGLVQMDRWRQVLTQAIGREIVPGGARILFPADPERAAGLAQLAAAEHDCCSSLDFSLHISDVGLELEVRSPEAATEMLKGLFEVAS